MKKIKILLTFDYEVPLGKCTDYQKGLFQPAESLLKTAQQCDVPLVFYTDVCSSFLMKKQNYEGYYIPFVNQVHEAIRGGHEIALHIHPHWVTSTFENGNFVPSADYSLSDFAEGRKEHTLESIINDAYNELVSICRQADPKFQCLAFRAGGYDVEPESARILTALASLGIRYESSVIKGLFLDYSFSRIDYRNAPQPSTWKVSTNGPLTTVASSGLMELPISSRPVNVRDIVARRWMKSVNGSKYRARVYNNGGKGFLAAKGSQSVAGTLSKITNPMVLSLDKEYLEYADLQSIVDYNVRKYSGEANDLVLTAIGHPKSMGPYHRDLMKRFVDGMRQQYGDQISFVTYRDLKLV